MKLAVYGIKFFSLDSRHRDEFIRGYPFLLQFVYVRENRAKIMEWRAKRFQNVELKLFYHGFYETHLNGFGDVLRTDYAREFFGITFYYVIAKSMKRADFNRICRAPDNVDETPAH